MFSDRIKANLVALAFVVSVCVMAFGGARAFAQGQEYKLGPGDKIRVAVLADPEFSGEYEVDTAGAISVRMIGRMSVTGMTPAQLESTLVERYRSGGYLRDPKLTVELINARPFFILGEVTKPGSYPYVAGLTVAHAAAIAGGYTRRASTSRIKIRRYGGAADEAATEDSVVNPGDIVRVPERYF